MSGWGGISAAEGNAAYVKRGALGDLHLIIANSSGTGTVNSGSGAPILGSATAGIGFIPPFACTITALSFTMSTLTTTGTCDWNVTAYRNATVGGTQFLQVLFSGMTADLPVSGIDTVPNGTATFNGTTDYITLFVNCTAGTSISAQIFTYGLYGTIT